MSERQSKAGYVRTGNSKCRGPEAGRRRIGARDPAAPREAGTRVRRRGQLQSLMPHGALSTVINIYPNRTNEVPISSQALHQGPAKQTGSLPSPCSLLLGYESGHPKMNAFPEHPTCILSACVSGLGTRG